MKNFLLSSIFILCTGLSNQAQPGGEPSVVKSQVSAYFIPVKIAYEHGIGKYYTIEFSAGVTGKGNYEESEFDYSIVPLVRGDFKHYYNLQKRYDMGKNTAMNSANFWGVMTRYSFKQIEGSVENPDTDWGEIFIAPMWGIQRNYKSHFSLGLNLGYGIVLGNDHTEFDPLVNLRLGFVLFSR